MTDYISREAVKAVLNERYKIRTHMHDLESAAQLKSAELEIGDIPAADVRPVVRAHWTDHRTTEHDGEWYCSACGKEITIYMGADRPDRYRFCPNCGAWMEER